MDAVWNNESRFNALTIALSRLSHDQTAIGLGFKLRHSPTSCARCRANIAVLELAAIMHQLENQEDSQEVEVAT